MNDSQEFTLTPHALTFSGAAVGRRDDGLTVFVPYGLPGETVRVRIVQDKGRYAIAALVERLSTAPERVTPRCPHFGPGKCGGCHWQHLDYAAQLVHKQRIVTEQLQRIGKISEPPVRPTLPSPRPYQYRLHVTVQTTPDALAFISTDGRTPYPIGECHIVREPIAAVIAAAADAASPDSAGQRLRLMTTAADEPPVRVVVRGGDDLDAPDTASSNQAVIQHIRGADFRVQAGGFFQVNAEQAAVLVDQVLAQMQPQPDQRLVDLYCGVGLFTRFLAEHAAFVTGIETNAAAVADARHNLRDFSNTAFIAADAGAGLRRVTGKIAGVVVDPPRAGLSAKTLNAIVQARPRRWVYVSCDPATLARDARLITEAGYRLDVVQPVDMFPQTYHVETVSCFVRG